MNRTAIRGGVLALCAMLALVACERQQTPRMGAAVSADTARAAGLGAHEGNGSPVRPQGAR